MLSEERLDELTALIPLLEESGAARTRALLAVPELIAEARRLHKGIGELAEDYELVDAEQLRALLAANATAEGSDQ